MKALGNLVLKGLAAVLPIGLTLYLVYWLGVSAEALLRPVIVSVLSESGYLPGMGLAAGLVLLVAVGLIINAWIFQRLLGLGEGLVRRIPLVKSIYGALRDFMDFFSTASDRKDLDSVVLVTVADMQLIGFLTREDARSMPGMGGLAEDTVAVYLPMSYQIGGYTVYLPKSRVQPIAVGVEDAMRMVLTAGVARQGIPPGPPSQAKGVDRRGAG